VSWYPCLRVYVAQIHVDLSSRFCEFLPESSRRPRDDWQSCALTNWASFTSSRIKVCTCEQRSEKIVFKPIVGILRTQVKRLGGERFSVVQIQGAAEEGASRGESDRRKENSKRNQESGNQISSCFFLFLKVGRRHDSKLLSDFSDSKTFVLICRHKPPLRNVVPES